MDPSGGTLFETVSRQVVSYLSDAIPMGMWAVSRYDGSDQVYLHVADSGYGHEPGHTVPWEDTFCMRMASGDAPQIAPDAMSEEVFAKARLALDFPVGAYVGIPLRWSDGELFGTLCGIDPERKPESLGSQAPLLTLLGAMLSSVLQADHDRVELDRELERATHLAHTDPLTGLPNRRAWQQTWRREEERQRRFGDPAAVVLIDLDGLKARNDALGHAAGDDYLRAATSLLRSTLRSTDFAARLGGDEFGVLLVGAGTTDTMTFVTRLRRTLSEGGVAASIGAAACRVSDGFATALEQADTAMYADKARRRRPDRAGGERSGHRDDREP